MKQDRFDKILEILAKNHSVQIRSLARELDVSNETIRRDLLELQSQSLLRCVRGGAVLDNQTTGEYDIYVRTKTSPVEKEAICRRAIELIDDGDSIAIEASTTTLTMGSLMAEKNGLTVITNSIYIGNEVAKNPSNTVIIAGGILNSEAQKNMGSMTVSAFRGIRVDKGLFSVSGLSAEFGVTEYNEGEADVVKAIVDVAKYSIILSDYLKFNTVGFMKTCDLNQVDTIVTDWHVTEKELLPFKKAGIKILTAEEPGTGSLI